MFVLLLRLDTMLILQSVDLKADLDLAKAAHGVPSLLAHISREVANQTHFVVT